MEEPDADELAWMMDSGFPDEIDEDVPDDVGPPSPVCDDVRKRLWPDDPGGSKPTEVSKRHRVDRTEHGITAPPPAVARQDPTVEWQPPRPPEPRKQPTDEWQPPEPPQPRKQPTDDWQPPEPPEPRQTPRNQWQPTEPPANNEDDTPSTSYGPWKDSPPRARKLCRMAADIEGECMPITGFNGERVYAQVEEKEEPARSGTSYRLFRGPSAAGSRVGDLLSAPIDKLLEEIEQLRYQRLLEESELLAKAETSTRPGQPREERDQDREEVEEQLWVEKYAPRSFTELLSDEHNNRELLRWLKQWDPCVFGTACTVREENPELARHSTGRGHLPTAKGRGSFKGTSSDWGNSSSKGHYGRGGSSRSLGEKPGVGGHLNKVPGGVVFSSGVAKPKRVQADRPDEKVILLCGPPGAGKTTLANVAARHCGYRVVEVNASDDRAASALKERILDAVQMQPVMGDRRPNCLVIDEIDGVLNGAEGKSAIHALLEIVQADKPKGSKASEDEAPEASSKTAGKGKKKVAGVRRLSRPIICICNDLYAPALRPLRQVAKVITFSQPTANRLTTRLKTICRLESFRADDRALALLCEHTECDVRSCLNTLQFLRKKGRQLQAADMASQVIGRKDMTHSMFDIWQEVFQKKKGKTAGKEPPAQMTKSLEQQDFTRVNDLVSGYGEYDFVMEGVHENFLKMRYHDSTLEKTVACLEWMGDSEVMGRRTIARQQHFLMAYQPACVLSVRRLVASIERPHIDFPRASAKFRSDRGARGALLATWQSGMAPALRRGLPPAGGCVTDIVSPLLTLLKPTTLRPVAAQLLTEKERGDVTELVDTMLSFGLTYSLKATGLSYSEKMAVVASGPQLDPAIHVLATFQEAPPQRRQLSITLRQMLAHELELEAIRRESATRAARNKALQSTQDKISPSKPEQQQPKEAPQPTKHLSQAPASSGARKSSTVQGAPAGKDKPLKPVAVKAPVDFFGSFKKRASSSAAPERGGHVGAREAFPILYKFHEGFTNAVRRPVLLRDLLALRDN